MPSQCCVFKCKNTKTLHTFPKTEPLREQWRKACDRPDEWEPSPSSKVCQQHFLPQDFRSNGRLKSLAIPFSSGTSIYDRK